MLFAIVGTAGNAILFVCSLVAVTVLAVYTFAFAAHCYLVVVKGRRRVETASIARRANPGLDPSGSTWPVFCCCG